MRRPAHALGIVLHQLHQAITGLEVADSTARDRGLPEPMLVLVIEEPADSRNLRDLERHHIQEVLKQEKGNKAHTAKALGISRRALYRLIEKYKLGTEEES